jgi:hypothetical protein
VSKSQDSQQGIHRCHGTQGFSFRIALVHGRGHCAHCCRIRCTDWLTDYASQLDVLALWLSMRAAAVLAAAAAAQLVQGTNITHVPPMGWSSWNVRNPTRSNVATSSRMHHDMERQVNTRTLLILSLHHHPPPPPPPSYPHHLPHRPSQAFHSNISEDILVSQARALKAAGLLSAGYTRFNIDGDHWPCTVALLPGPPGTHRAPAPLSKTT